MPKQPGRTYRFEGDVPGRGERRRTNIARRQLRAKVRGKKRHGRPRGR